MNLVNIDKVDISIDSERKVCARELHAFLEVGSRFSDWIRRRIAEYGFVQGIDFIILRNEYNDIKELRVTIDMAKELCMVEKNSKGKQARRYFIDVENKWRLANKSPQTTLEVLQASVNMLVAQEKRISDVEDRLDMLNGDTGFRTVLAYSRENGIPLPNDLAKRIGKTCSALCRRRGITPGKVPDERYGSIGSYPIEILDEVFEAME